MKRDTEMISPPLIAGGILTHRALSDHVIIVAGGGRGMGYETARSLAWLGGHLVIVESDSSHGRESTVLINHEIRSDSAIFVKADYSDEKSVIQLARQIFRKYGRVDAVINITTALIGPSIQEAQIRDWDVNYRVNLRGPALMARVFLPAMLQRDYGVFLSISANEPTTKGVFTCLKSAQIELVRALDVELEDSGVITFNYHPGKISVQDRSLSRNSNFSQDFEEEMTIEAAGAGCAAAVAFAPRFRGMEINARQALAAAGIKINEIVPGIRLDDWITASRLCAELRIALAQQAEMWSTRSQLERQWMLREFKRRVGLGSEECQQRLVDLESFLIKSRLPHHQAYQRLFTRLADTFMSYSARAEENTGDAFAHGASAIQLTAWAAAACSFTDLIQRGHPTTW